MKKLAVSAFCLALMFIAILFYSFRSIVLNPEPVRIESGLISGVTSQSGDVMAYKGIPFAVPPVGELRWKAPRPVEPWQGIKKCEAFGPSPMQNIPVPFGVYTPEFLIPAQPISEDCLYLNVWTKGKESTKKPVFVWIYGGGFMTGGAAVPIYDGEAMAKKGIVFVSINYRVGIFGFMAHPELSRESPEKASGNYALLDQIAALRWVKKNISAFGGDPDNVTIGGQSAGSMSVNCLVASPVAKGFFSKAIAESGSFLIDKLHPVVSLKDAEQNGIKLAEKVKAASLNELRKIPADVLLKAGGSYSPIVDGYVMPETVEKIFAGGKQNNVPVLTGWNADEGFVFSYKKMADFQADIKQKYGNKANEAFKYFPSNSDEEAAQSQLKMSRDMIFAASGYKWAFTQSGEGNAPIYLYYFARKLPATPDFEKYGAFHTGEVAYVMDNLKFLDRPWLPQDHELAKTMSAYWVNFITTGDPNGKGLPNWPKFGTSTLQAMLFDKSAMSGRIPDKEELKFIWAENDK